MTGGPRPLFEPAPDPLSAPLHAIAGELLPAVLHEPAPELPEDEPVTTSYADQVRAARTHRPSTSPEAAIVAEILDWLNVQPHVHARKVHQTAVTGSGEPDLDICWRGRAVKIEVKRPGERPTRVQVRRLLTWGEAGALVGWVTSLEDLRTIVAYADDPAYRPNLSTSGA